MASSGRISMEVALESSPDSARETLPAIDKVGLPKFLDYVKTVLPPLPDVQVGPPPVAECAPRLLVICLTLFDKSWCIQLEIVACAIPRGSRAADFSCPRFVVATCV